ncbi:MAG: DUF222 domain-containing protein [Demequina sp.]|nr:DUF222 domain-containing protein [Demequina sp.]
MTAEAIAYPLEGSGDAALVELWRHVDELNALRPASQLSGQRALDAATVIAKVRHAADALLAPYAARLEELSDSEGFARYKGSPNAAALLSKHTGLSTTEAGKLIGLGQALADAGARASDGPVLSVVPDVEQPNAGDPAGDELAFGEPSLTSLSFPAPAVPTPPHTQPQMSPLAAAIRAGWLGTEKAVLIRRNLEDMTVNRAQAEALMVESARQLSIVALRRLCLETFAELDPEGYADRERRQHEKRFFKVYDEVDGTVNFFGSLPPALAAPVKAWFDAELQTALNTQRDDDPRSQRKVGQIMADTLVAMALHVSGCELATTRPQSTFVIRASKTSLESGAGFASCDGVEAPITIGRVLAMAADVQFAALLQGKGGVPLALGRTRRLASGGQRLAVAERDRGCAKCSAARSRANFHHIITWDDGGPTDERNLVMLCVSCHTIIHEEGWGVVIEDNQVWFIPPASVDLRRRRQPGSSVRPAA